MAFSSLECNPQVFYADAFEIIVVKTTFVHMATDDTPPLDLTCPIAGDLMRQPVLAGDGVTYEKSAIAEWITNGRPSHMTHTSAIANLPLALVDNTMTSL